MSLNADMMIKIGEYGIGIVVLFGALLSAVSAFGLIKLPDVYLRSHAATKSATLGVLFILTGAFLYFLFFLDHVSVKLLLGIVFVFITSPVAGHLNGRAAYRTGVSQWSGSVMDDLHDVLKKERSAQQHDRDK
jgi:multicomponent Na+:H+ antiporter subunit G